MQTNQFGFYFCKPDEIGTSGINLRTSIWNKMKIKILVILTFGLLITMRVSANKTTDSLLLVLDKAIDNKEIFLQTKKQRIEALTEILRKSANISYYVRNDVYNELYIEYRSFNYDSAFTYSLRLLQNAYQSKNQLLIDKSRIKVGFTLLSAGLFKETLDTLDNISEKDLPDSTKIEFYYLLARTYYDMADYTGDYFYAPFYVRKGNQMMDLAICQCKDSSRTFLSLSGLKFLREGKMQKARYFYEKLLKDKTLDGHQYAIEASSLSFIYKNDNEPELAEQMLIKAAIADIVVSTKETVALRNLAEIIYREGNIKRAYTYVKVAMDDAYFYGARHRKIQISDILPSIEDQQLEIVQHQRKTFFIYSLSITMLSLLTILFGIIIFKQLKNLRKAKKYLSFANDRLSEINHRLTEANMIKEEYIGHFFDTISDYINQFEKIKVNIDRKLTTRQFDSIKDVTASIDIRKEREQFYHNFDSIFLKIFPNFIEEFNSYLKEELVIQESNQLLTPEVRIYALIRLGFSNNDKIAKFLGYSLNTIYAYKTKIKNRLNIPVEEFEKKITQPKKA